MPCPTGPACATGPILVLTLFGPCGLQGPGVFVIEYIFRNGNATEGVPLGRCLQCTGAVGRGTLLCPWQTVCILSCDSVHMEFTHRRLATCRPHKSNTNPYADPLCPCLCPCPCPRPRPRPRPCPCHTRYNDLFPAVHSTEDPHVYLDGDGNFHAVFHHCYKCASPACHAQPLAAFKHCHTCTIPAFRAQHLDISSRNYRVRMVILLAISSIHTP